MKFSLVLIDDEPTIREGISFALESAYHLRTFETAEDGLAAIEAEPPDLVLLDVGLPGMNGIEALRAIREMHPEMLVIMITAYEDSDTVISAMKLGAYDYVVKPIIMGGLLISIRNALESIRLRKEVRLLQESSLKDQLPFFIAESDRIQEVMDFIAKAAGSSDTPVLILGETGTGKELIASAIHYRSPNFKGPYVTLNCATIPKDLIESELFGYEKGAFSGAGQAGKRGLIEEAADGTLFLDEVGDLSLQSQAKLLRFLEEGEFYRVGSTQKRHIRTRVVSATNKDLEEMMDQGLFRRDLYYRLGVVEVHVPSLNERKDDIMPLANHFLVTFSGKFRKKFTRISDAAEKALKAHHWVGNVRELKNLVERGVLIGEGPELTVEDMGLLRRPSAKPVSTVQKPGDPLVPPEGFDLPLALEEYEARYLREALALAGGNESQAARLLNMNHYTFRYRRKKLLQDP